MKHLFIIFLSSVLVQFGWSQELRLLDSVITSVYTDNNWEIDGGIIYEPLMDGGILASNFSIEDDRRHFFTNEILEFHDSGNFSTVTVQKYDELSSLFVNDVRDSYVYDADDNLVSITRQQWDRILEDWMDDKRVEYLLYDSFNNFLQSDRYNYDPEDGWELASKMRINNFYENDLLDSCYKIRNGMPFYHSVYNYDEQNLLREQEVVFYYLAAPNIHAKYSYEYNEENLRSVYLYEDYSLSIDQMDYIPRFKEYYDYNIKGALVQNTREVFDLSEQVFNPAVRQNYFYQISTQLEDLISTELEVQWNNSMIGQVEICVKELNVGEKYRLSIFDNSGRMVKNATIENTGQWAQRYSMESGMYHLVIYDAHGKRQVQKFIVN